MEEYDDWQCPKCGWDSANGEPDPEDGQVEYTDYETINSLDGPYFTWLERWTCPECGTIFEVSNSN